MASRTGWVLAVTALAPSLLMAYPALSPAAEERLGERTFLVRDKKGTPTQFQMIVQSGCNDEAGALCRGIAHYLEHLVLVGRNPEHKEIALRFFPDASSNGWTSQRATVYVHSVPARAEGPRADLERLFEFYAARLKDFSINEADAERERNVVRQEHDWRVGSRPVVRFVRDLDRALMPDHPSGQWVTGTLQDIDGYTLEEARAYHRTWYVLNNVYFVVRADIDGSILKGIADKALAGAESRPLPPRAFGNEPELVIERKDIRETDPTLQRPVVYYKKLVRFDNTELAAAAARTVVTGFMQSRLPGSTHDAVVDKTTLAAGPPSVSLIRVAQKSFVLTIGASVAQDVAPDTLLTGIADYVDKLASNSISNDSVMRLKQRLADANAANIRDPKRGYDRLVGWLANRNRYEDFALQPRRIAAVSHEQVASVLRVLAGPGRVVTGIMSPSDAPK